MIIHGDSLTEMRAMKSETVDLIMTSPPYADARKHTYGGVPPDEYIEWFMPFATEMKRILKPSGSVVINIKEKAVNGQRHTYVIRLILTLIERTDLLWIDEYVWHKSNPFPCKPIYRLKDAWERVLHFTVSKHFKFRPDNIVRISKQVEWRKYIIDPSTNSNMKINKNNTYGRETAYPDNVIHGASESQNKGHSAVFPEYLPAFFIKLLTDEKDTVLDPFCGSGTTCVAAQQLNRNAIGIDADQNAIDTANKRLAQRMLL